MSSPPSRSFGSEINPMMWDNNYNPPESEEQQYLTRLNRLTEQYMAELAAQLEETDQRRELSSVERVERWLQGSSYASH